MNFFAEAYLVDSRASKHYKYFVDKFLFYQSLFENSGDLTNILMLPYPLYNDIIIGQVAEKKREKKELEKKMRHKTVNAKTRKTPTRK